MENSPAELQNIINSHHEWLLIYVSGKSFSLKNTEIELEFTNHKTLFSFPADQGFQTWRVTDFKTKNTETILDLSRNFDKEHAKIRLVPRIPAHELTENLELARLEKANKIAQIVKENSLNSKLIRVELNKENGRFAQIIFKNSRGKQTAVLADVTDKLTPEILLSTAILWLAKLSARHKNPIEQIWICAEKKQAKNLQNLHALLKENWKNSVLIKGFSRADNQTLDDLPSLKISELWRGKTKEIKSAENFQTSATVQKITKFAPEEIDAIFARNGETLRFSGLPFARIRKISDTEKVWLGVEKSMQLLSENNFDEFAELLENLREFRAHNSPNKRHVFYQSAPEAWLESILRRNIKLLDANLILSPVYHQFRAERDKIDLLALRKDGRLVIIELKVEPDREMIFQAADYWRKIERARRSGNLQKAQIFGDLEIADAPAICYLVAPTLCFHRDFGYLKNTVSDEIEIHRFNLAENWRESLKVLERI
jgi:hypothetical protein